MDSGLACRLLLKTAKGKKDNIDTRKTAARSYASSPSYTTLEIAYRLDNSATATLRHRVFANTIKECKGAGIHHSPDLGYPTPSSLQGLHTLRLLSETSVFECPPSLMPTVAVMFNKRPLSAGQENQPFSRTSSHIVCLFRNRPFLSLSLKLQNPRSEAKSLTICMGMTVARHRPIPCGVQSGVQGLLLS